MNIPKTRIYKSRRIYWCPIEKQDIKFARFVWNMHHPDDSVVKGDGYHIHHKDENPLNDHPDNLQKITHGTHSCAHNQNNGNGMYGRKHSKESRAKMSKAKMGNLYCLGRTASKETRQKLSASANSEGKNNGMYGKKHSKESIAKMSEARKRYYRCSMV